MAVAKRTKNITVRKEKPTMDDMLGDALKTIFGPLKNLMEQLQGNKRELWLQVLQQLSRMKPETVLLKLSRPISPPLWIKIEVGGLKLKPLQIIEKFTTAGVGPNHKFPLMFSLIEYQRGINAETKDVEFVKGSLYDLFGFTRERTSVDYFLNNGFLAQYGLELCEPADAISIRLAWKDQRDGERAFVGTKPYYYTRKEQPEEGLYPLVPSLMGAAGKVWFGEDWALADQGACSYTCNDWIFRRNHVQS